MATAWRAGEPLWRRARWVPFRANANPPSKERLTTMARLTFRRLLLVGVAVGAAAAYAKREQVRQLLPGGASSGPEPYSPPVPAPSNYDAPGPPANTSTPVPAP